MRIFLPSSMVACSALIVSGIVRLYSAPVPIPRTPVTYDDRTLQKLVALMPPPAKPIDTGDAASWAAAEKALGTSLPEDYKRFFGVYGVVGINRDLVFADPIDYDNENIGLGPRLDFERLFQERRKRLEKLRDKVRPVWPEPGGILPIARTDSGDSLCYATRGKPSEWRVVALSREGEFEELGCGLTEFLLRLAEGKAKSAILLRPGVLVPPLSVR